MPLKGLVAEYGGNGVLSVCTHCRTVVPVKRVNGHWQCGNHPGGPKVGEYGPTKWAPTKQHRLVELDCGLAFCRACREAVNPVGVKQPSCPRRPWAGRGHVYAVDGRERTLAA